MASASIASPRPGAQGLSHGAGRPAPVSPLVTIIMPIRPEARSIARALPAVLAQDDPADNRASIVVDGMSEAGTCAIVTAMAGGAPRGQCMENPERIVPTALNRGGRAAHGESIIRVDGHAVMAPDSLRRCVETLAGVDADCVGGPIQTVGETPRACAIALAQSSPFGLGNAAFRYARTARYSDVRVGPCDHGGAAGAWPAPYPWLLAVLLPYSLVLLGASLWLAAHHGWQYAPLLPLAFLTLHLGDGRGCLRGLLSWVCPGGGAQGSRMRHRSAHGQPEPGGALQKQARHQRRRKPPGRRRAPHTREREHEHTCEASLGPEVCSRTGGPWSPMRP